MDLGESPFSTIGDPDQLLKKPELDDLFELIHSAAA